MGSLEKPAQSNAEYEHRLVLALRLLEGWQLEEARAGLKSAIACEPSRPEAWNLLGVIGELAGETDQAQRYFRAALALDPRFPAARNNLFRGGAPALDLELGPNPSRPPRLPMRSVHPNPRRTLARLSAASSSPYRSPDPPAPRVRRRSWLGVLLVVGGLLAAAALFLWSDASEQRAVVAMPPSERLPLFRRTLEDLELCAKGTAPSALLSHCTERATWIRRFPECDERCRSLARSVSAPTR